jgi:dienelactone hydrolase
MIGQTVGHYRVLERLGGGGMGVVYKAEDTLLGRIVAVKFPLPDRMDDTDARNRFLREARAASRLDHPNICTVHEVGETDGQIWLAMACYEGETLQERIARGPLPIDEALDIATQIVRGLAKAHESGITHRDIKPANVILTSDGIVKILDFGLAKQSGVATLTSGNEFMGTLAYMAPEQLNGETVGPTADLWSTGVVLFEMLSHQRPFVGETPQAIAHSIINKQPASVTELRPDAPPDLDELLEKLLQKDPLQRIRSADEVLEKIDTLTGQTSQPITPGRASARRRIALSRRLLRGALVLLVVAGLGAVTLVQATKVVRHQREVARARSETLPRIMQLIERHDLWTAFVLARQVEDLLPEDPLLASLWPQFAGEISWRTNPPGAAVFARPSSQPDAPWVSLGSANGSDLHTPIGCMLFRFEHPERKPAMVGMALAYGKAVFDIALPTNDETAAGMTRIDPPSHETLQFAPEFSYRAGDLVDDIGSFLIDTHEVTNREYKAFVDDGGYRRRELWKLEDNSGKGPSFEETMAKFVDTTGRPGPSGWELGTWPEGTAERPVTGVSWFEAAAYAKWAGKSLPTVFHWWAAAAAANGACWVPHSNFSGTLEPVGGREGSVNLRGLHDMAGNAREWCLNAIENRRATMGGACDGPAYRFFHRDSQDPFERNPTTGFRCIRLLTPSTMSERLTAPVIQDTGRVSKDWRGAEPFPDDVWETWKRMLAYVDTPLESRVELVDDSSRYWRMEKVSFAASYGYERMTAYLFLPKRGKPPYQAVVFWPGGVAARLNSSDNGRNVSDSKYWGYLVRDGRALLYPILKGTYERGGGTLGYTPRPEDWVMQAKDVMRSVDYMESRDDIDISRLAYFGFSWGAHRGMLACAGEPRFRVAILQSGGVTSAEVLGWAHRIHIPVQMVSGRYDTSFPHETCQVPLFEALATPAPDKRAIILDTDHGLAGADKEVMKANLEWLDRYLGAVANGNGGGLPTR